MMCVYRRSASILCACVSKLDCVVVLPVVRCTSQSQFLPFLSGGTTWKKVSSGSCVCANITNSSTPNVSDSKKNETVFIGPFGSSSNEGSLTRKEGLDVVGREFSFARFSFQLQVVGEGGVMD